MRWILKKSARAALAALSWISGWLFVQRWMPRRGQVRVLTYHRVGDAARDPFCVRVDEFERQMAWLARRRLAISLADLQEFLAGGERPPRGSVLVTVDDGCPCLYSRIAPIAERHGIPLVAFVPAGEVTADDAAPRAGLDGPDARITEAELRALAARGVVIGSHAYTHRSLGRLAPSAVRTEAERSRAVLREKTGQAVEAFAYPFGTRADYNDTAAEILRAAGYRCAFTSQHGAISSDTDPFTLPRVKIEGGEGLWMFRLIVRGALDDWRWIDRIFWRLQEAR